MVALHIPGLLGFAEKEDGELKPTFTSGFGQSLADVALDGANAEDQAFRNGFIAQPFPQQVAHPLFGGGEGVEGRHRVAGCLLRGFPLSQLFPGCDESAGSRPGL